MQSERKETGRQLDLDSSNPDNGRSKRPRSQAKRPRSRLQRRKGVDGALLIEGIRRRATGRPAVSGGLRRNIRRIVP